MNKATIDKKFLYDMEYIRGAMEIKRGQAFAKNPKMDLSDIDNKIELATGVVNHIYQLHELLNQISKEQFKLEFINEKLVCELLSKR